MEIRVNLISKDIYTFDLPVERPLEFINKIRPTDVFQRPLHQFLGKLRTVSINPEWIELDTMDLPKKTPFEKTATIRQLSPESFKSWLNKQKTAIVASMEKEVSQNIVIAYGQATFKSGRMLHFEIQAKLERMEDRTRISQQIFKMPALFIYGEKSGMYLVNTNNIAVWQVVPGLKKSGFFSVAGELTGTKKGGMKPIGLEIKGSNSSLVFG